MGGMPGGDMGGMMPPGGDMGGMPGGDMGGMLGGDMGGFEPAPAPEPAPPQQVFCILVEKYGYEWVDGVAYKPGAAQSPHPHRSRRRYGWYDASGGDMGGMMPLATWVMPGGDMGGMPGGDMGGMMPPGGDGWHARR